MNTPNTPRRTPATCGGTHEAEIGLGTGAFELGRPDSAAGRFIRAEIVSYAGYATYETMEAIRAAGTLRSEGKDDVMQEGDVVEFRFNV
jgi:Protein of unknown function (DUF933)